MSIKRVVKFLLFFLAVVGGTATQAEQPEHSRPSLSLPNFADALEPTTTYDEVFDAQQYLSYFSQAFDTNYQFLFELENIKRTQNKGRPITEHELTYIIEHSHQWGQQAKQKYFKNLRYKENLSADRYNIDIYDTKYFYHAALDAYASNNLSLSTAHSPQAASTFESDTLSSSTDSSDTPDTSSSTDIHYNTTPLHMAILKHDQRAFVTLLKYGVDINKKDAYGHSPLHLAWRMWGVQSKKTQPQYARKFIHPLLQHNAKPGHAMPIRPKPTQSTSTRSCTVILKQKFRI